MTRARTNADQAHTESLSVVPHIIPDVLYPAVANIMVDGSTALSASTTGPNSSTVTSSKYGTVQSDGRMYYYTDIKGSKPIKDPRIGAHFGSQRYKFKSVQLLEQETATHGSNVYSIDGREWIRTVGNQSMNNTNDGHYLTVNAAGEFIEITGYFNDANIILLAGPGQDIFNLHLNGTSLTDAGVDTSIATPIGNRYVDGGSVVNIAFSTTPTLGINTITITYQEWLGVYGIELIAQDTSSTANRSKIQIPSQNVVSYGKKFTVSGTPHYNPFAFKTDGTTSWTSGNHNGTAWPVGTGSSANIDTATSLGLDAWVSTNYYYPYNGGRVVWWVDSSGTLKCSVNMMPPNARNITSTAVTEKGDDSAGTTSAAVANNTYLPTFTDQAIDHSLAEVAKTYNFREFGNGSANGGSAGTYRDFSTLDTNNRNIAYVMDDGLTSLTADSHAAPTSPDRNGQAYRAGNDNEPSYITFIGTGISGIRFQDNSATKEYVTYAQNLPYGTHVLKLLRVSGGYDAFIDGVEIENLDGSGGAARIAWSDFTFHQPKKPPIPEDAVVLADYMLMADYVAQTAAGATKISKGVRRCNGTRDVMYDSSAAFTGAVTINLTDGGEWGFFAADSNSGQVMNCTLPYFGTTAQGNGQAQDAAGFNNMQYSVSGSAYANSTETILNNNDHTYADPVIITTAMTLGSNGIKHILGGGGYKFVGFDVVSPIHTSSHYQSFETPFLKELVGGDRNMEQTNLVVTADGKTWDEVTRDTSYIGNTVVQMYSDNGADTLLWDMCRGALYSYGQAYQKDFAIAYDRLICLKSMECKIHLHDRGNSSADTLKILVNGGAVMTGSSSLDDNWTHSSIDIIISLKRGDYVQAYAVDSPTSAQWGNFHITRLN